MIYDMSVIASQTKVVIRLVITVISTITIVTKILFIQFFHVPFRDK